MKLINNSTEFKLNYGADEYTVPNGEFDVVDVNLGNHILFIANKWDRDVKEIPQDVTPIKPTPKEAIKATEPKKVEEPKVVAEVIVEEPKVTEEDVVKTPVAETLTETLKRRGRPKRNVEPTA